MNLTPHHSTNDLRDFGLGDAERAGKIHLPFTTRVPLADLPNVLCGELGVPIHFASLDRFRPPIATSARYHVQGVFLEGSINDVLGIYAWRIVAGVPRDAHDRNASSGSERKAMRSDRDSTGAKMKSAVPRAGSAHGAGASPRPAFVFTLKIDESEEPNEVAHFNLRRVNRLEHAAHVGLYNTRIAHRKIAALTTAAGGTLV